MAASPGGGAAGYLKCREHDLAETQELQGWDKITRHIYVWDYPRNNYPLSYLDQQNINIRTWLENGVTGVFLEDLEFNLNNLARLHTWVFMQKLWNPDWDLDALVEDYIAGHYGEAAPEMREYVQIQRDCWKRFNDAWTPGEINTMKYSPEEFKQMQELLDAAYLKTPNEDIAREICCLNAAHLKVCRKNAIAEYEARMGETLQLLEKHNIRLVTLQDEHQKIIADWKEQLQEAKSGVDYPLYHESSLVLKEANIAIHHNSKQKEPGSYLPQVYKQVRNTDWGLQWMIEKLMANAVNQTRYVVRIRVKPHFTSRHAAADDAFGLHLWRSGFSANAVPGRNVKVGELKNNEWQYVYLYKAYFYSPSVYGYFYTTTGPIKENEYMLYDLIEFIPLERFEDTQLADSLPEITI